MPRKSLRYCKAPGCKNLVESGYCKDHAIETEYPRLYPEHQKMYNARWRKYRRMYLNEHPLCINYEVCHNEATVVDHIKDHKGDYELFWNPDNHQQMCADCHNKKTGSEFVYGKKITYEYSKQRS